MLRKRNKDNMLDFSWLSERASGQDHSRIKENMTWATSRRRADAAKAMKTAATLGNLATTRTDMVVGPKEDRKPL